MISENSVRAIRDMHMDDIKHLEDRIKNEDLPPVVLSMLEDDVRIRKGKLHLLDLILEEKKDDDWYS